jgi:hypothetical protein
MHLGSDKMRRNLLKIVYKNFIFGIPGKFLGFGTVLFPFGSKTNSNPISF